MSRMAFALWSLGAGLVAACFASWFVVHMPMPDWLAWLGRVAGWFYGPTPLATGFAFLLAGLAAWLRAWPPGLLGGSRANHGRLLPFVALFLGAGLVATTGFLELHAPADALPRVPHALVGIGSVVLLAVGRALGGWIEHAVVPSSLRSLARAIRILAFLALAIGLLVPFTPRFFGDETPRACAIRVAALGALVFAVPLAAASLLAILAWRDAALGAVRSSRCPRCGYPRTNGGLCPECGVRAAGSA